MLRNVEDILLGQFSEYLESFSVIWSGIRYILHKKFGLVFIESPCIVMNSVEGVLYYNDADENHQMLQEIMNLLTT